MDSSKDGLKATVTEIHRRLQSAEKIMVVSHLRPDGDAIGAMVALGLAIEATGKSAQMVLEDGIPVSYRHLEGSDRVLTHPKEPVDLVIVLDTSDLKRAGNVLNGYDPPDINIDHHITNENFGKINLVVPKAVATTEILAENMIEFGLSINQPVASALLTGLVTDTIGFRTSNVTPGVLRLAANLMERGANLGELYTRSLTNKSYEAIRFWGAGLTKLNRDNEIVWTTLTLDDRKESGYQGRDDADLINVLSTIHDFAVYIIFVEQPNKKVKVSWRAKPELDVSIVASSFGGGGHPAASGAEIQGDLDAVRQKVLQETQKLLFPNK